MIEPLDLNPELTPTEEPTLDLHQDATNPVLPKDQVEKRAMKYNVAMGNASPGTDAITAALMQGTEEHLRDAAVADAWAEDKNARRDLIQSYVMDKPDGTLEAGEYDFLNSLATPQLTEPRTVLEKKYADWVVSSHIAEAKNGNVEKANQEDFDAATTKASSVISKKEYARKAAEDVRAMSGWGDWAAHAIVPGYSWYADTHAAPEGTSDSGAMLEGNVLEAQVKDTWLRNDQDFYKSVDDVRSRVERGELSAAAGANFLEKLVSFTPWDRRTGNINSVITATDVIPGVGLSGDIGKAIITRGARVLAKNAAIKEGETAVRDSILDHLTQYGAQYDSTTNKGYTTGGREFTVKGTSITSSRTGENISARLVRGKDGSHTVEIDPTRIQSDFDKKVWTKPRVEGVRALPEDAFKSADEWRDFLIHHEVAHIDMPRGDLTLAQYENVVNQKALRAMGKSFGPEMTHPITGETVPTFAKDIVDSQGNKTTVKVPDTPNTRAQGTLDAAVENASRNEIDPEEIHVTAGNTEDAAVERIINDAKPNAIPGDKLGLGKDLSRRIASFFDPEMFLRRGSRMAGTAQREFVQAMARSKDALLRALYDGVQAQRVTRAQLEGALPALKEEIRKSFHGPDNAVLDGEFNVIHEADNVAQANYFEMGLGRADGTLFANPDEAADTAVNVYRLNAGSFETVQKGDGYFLRLRKAVDETNPKFRDLLIDTAHTTPVSSHAMWSSMLAKGDTFVSEAAKENRIVASHQASKIHEAMYDAAKDIGQISKKESAQLEKILEMNRDTKLFAGTKDEQHGFWYKTVGDFERGYYRMYKEFPSDKVTRAYFTYRQLMDYDYMVRNIRLYRDKVRLGIQKFDVAVPFEQPLEDGTVETTMQMARKPIEGRLVDDVIKDGSDKRVLILDSDKPGTHYVRTQSDGMAKINEYKAKGYKLIEIANPDQRPLMRSTNNDNLVQYALVKDFQADNLDFMQIPYREGGHIQVNANWKVSQPKIITTSDGSKLHVGDNHFVFVSSEKEAKFWAERMEKARQMLLKGDEAGLRDYLPKYTPYKSVEEFKNLFKERVVNGETVDPTFQPDTPFIHVADRQGTNDAAKTYGRAQLSKHFEGVEDTLDMPENKYRLLDKKFAGQKSETARTINGEEAAWKFEPARHVSPMKVMQDSMANIGRNIALDNVQHQAAETFAQEFADVLNVSQDALRQNPWEHLLNPEWNTRADPARLATAKAQRMATINFLGMKDPARETSDWLKNKLLNSVFERFGKGGADWVDDHLLPYVTDPSKYIRSMVFHMKLGFFNPVQLFLQAQTMLHSIAITGNPQRAASAMAATALMSIGRATQRPEIIESLAKTAGKLGWKPEQFKEMWKIAQDQGLHIVGGEVGSLGTLFQPPMFKGKVGSWLNKGTFFFKEGERSNRLNAWAIAYKEFREANPTKTIEAADVAKMMRRQDNLTMNMTHASNSAWQQGLFSIPTQFMGYQARLFEQLWGKTLTSAEKMRLVGMYSTVYGVPVTIGAGAIYPFGDDIREEAMARGINVDDGVMGALMNGMAATALEWATGTQYNVGERMGPGGLQAVRDFYNGDKTVLDVVGGASGSVLMDTLKTIAPAVQDLVTFDMQSLASEDFPHAFQEISTVSNVTKLIYGLRTGKLVSKNGTILGPMNTMDSWVQFTTGLTPQEISDAYHKLNIMDDVRKAEGDMDKQFKRYLTRAYELPPNSPERQALVKKAYTFMVDRDPSDAHRLVMEVISGKDVTTTTDKKFVKGGPVSTRDARKAILGQKQLNTQD